MLRLFATPNTSPIFAAKSCCVIGEEHTQLRQPQNPKRQARYIVVCINQKHSDRHNACRAVRLFSEICADTTGALTWSALLNVVVGINCWPRRSNRRD